MLCIFNFVSTSQLGIPCFRKCTHLPWHCRHIKHCLHPLCLWVADECIRSHVRWKGRGDGESCYHLLSCYHCDHLLAQPVHLHDCSSTLYLLTKLALITTPHHNRFTALFRDHLDEPVPEENLWTLWCKGRLTEADTLTIRLGAIPSALSSAHFHHPPFFNWPDALPAAQPTVSKH